MNIDSMAKPALIFCHGVWHGPEYWKKNLIPALESEGFHCVAEQMIFAGDSPVNGIKPAIDQMAELIEAEVSKGRNVILVNHSFGGSVRFSGAKAISSRILADSRKDTVASLVYAKSVHSPLMTTRHLSTCRGLENMVAYFTIVIRRGGRYLRTGTI